MIAEQKAKRLQTMMVAYEGARHTVVGLGVQGGAYAVLGAGEPVPGASFEEVIFEIGSITKVFTSILLCLLVEEGKVDPTAPLRDLSDELADVPEWITPESLASHTSGLPRIHVPIWKALLKPLPKDPYSEFSRKDLLVWFQNWEGKSQGSKRRHAYSNLGTGLLGEAMALREGKPFEDLLSEKVLAPLGLIDTTDRLNQDQLRRFAHPRNAKGVDVFPWTFRAMAGAGCLRSTARDLARFAGRAIEAVQAPETTLDRAICRSTNPIFGMGPRGGLEPAAQCAGWISMKLDKTEPRFLYHDGATAGSTCALYICPDRAEACAILSNNGIEANLWRSAKLSWSNQLLKAQDYFEAE